MTEHPNIEDRARSLIEGRMQSVRALVDADTTTKRARAAVEEAEKAHAAAWADAERQGWTSTELTKIGLTPPRTRRPGRPRTQRRRPQPAAEQAQPAAATPAPTENA